ncbi:toll/interleukin-1 receptor domain-containing protein [Streptomyces sp. NPDC048288]|uniref:toll/interleukin-1 receptor domain-containing protein n=1 Tax=Streptomyces sp. NPDC048288 TaxID=3365529 RepID=UPI00371CD381
MPSIFINYRTADSLPTATLIDRDLCARFGAEEVFRAGRSIKGGTRFSEEIRRALRKCDVLLALIGAKWLDARTPDGRRALDDETDWVRSEIMEAFGYGLTVIPVLLDQTPRLRKGDVPDALDELLARQTFSLNHRDPDHDLDRIAQRIVEEVPALGGRRILSGRRGNGPAAPETLRGNLFLGRTTVEGDAVGGDKHVWGTGERHE